MANICDTAITMYRESEPFSQEEIDNIIKDMNETVTYDGDASDSWYGEADEEQLETTIGTRWNVPTEALQKLAEKYNMKIVARGTEPAVGFVQVVKIDNNGKVLSDQELDTSI